MTSLQKIVRIITYINAYISYGVLVLMMLFVGVAAVLRSFGHPIMGDVELYKQEWLY